MLYMFYFGDSGDVLHKLTREAKRAKGNTVETNIVLTLMGFKTMKLPRGGGGGGTPLHGLYRYVRPQGVWFFSCVGHK